tara:strand:- start:920 stop:1261 length:342 start_codon:yes stop_codon:yes gene_type:complete
MDVSMATFRFKSMNTSQSGPFHARTFPSPCHGGLSFFWCQNRRNCTMSFRRIATKWTTDTATHVPHGLRLKLMVHPQLSDAGMPVGAPTSTQADAIPAVEAFLYDDCDAFIFT